MFTHQSGLQKVKIVENQEKRLFSGLFLELLENAKLIILNQL